MKPQPALLSEICAAQMAESTAARRREMQAKIDGLEQALRLDPAQPDWYGLISKYHRELADLEAAEAALRRGISSCPSANKLYWQLATTLQESGRTEEAIALAVPAMQKTPKGLQFRFLQHLMLPVIYDTEEEVTEYRRRFTQGLQACSSEVFTADRETLEAYLEGIRNFVSFYLPYQGYNDLELERQYGHLVHHVMQAHYPQWSVPLAMPDPGPDGRIRVGFASRFLNDHVVGKLLVGWLEHCDHSRLHIHAYYLGDKEDPTTGRIREASHCFFQESDFEAMCSQIRKDELHVLICPDIGMSAKTNMLAALRLAPVQCTTWLHPGTTGLPTVDYFLSSESMEPPDAQQHYSERLVLLPGMGMCLERPRPPRALLTKPRSYWGIPDDAVVYLCRQTMFKYLPRYDHIFPALAARAPKAKFIFIENYFAPAGKFQARLRRAFSAAGLNADDHCLMLPRQPHLDYWNLNTVCDVFLDSLGYSGGTTTLDALACELPVVTLAGEFMRGRQSYGMLRQMGITETIAYSEAEYIEIATRLGLDPEWRKALSGKIVESRHRLFGDTRGVRAWEEFLRQAVRERS